jgi:hypothetical protein
MKYFLVEPEVAGSLGERTAMDREVHPPKVTRLHYVFDGWLGDAIVESFPVFLVTEGARRTLDHAGVTGALFAKAEIETSDQFAELHPGEGLPAFLWLQPTGIAGHDDVATATDGRLVLSRRVIDLLGQAELRNALIEPFAP